MSRPYVWQKNEWGENEKVYLDSSPPSLGVPDCDMGGVSNDPWESNRNWQRENKTFIRDVHYDPDDPDPYGRL